jgi:DNA-binding response OmpR family regulator
LWSPSSQLRSELEADPASPAFILTDLGVGYRFVETAPIS